MSRVSVIVQEKLIGSKLFPVFMCQQKPSRDLQRALPKNKRKLARLTNNQAESKRLGGGQFSPI
jgi:hypothetical protein